MTRKVKTSTITANIIIADTINDHPLQWIIRQHTYTCTYVYTQHTLYRYTCACTHAQNTHTQHINKHTYMYSKIHVHTNTLTYIHTYSTSHTHACICNCLPLINIMSPYGWNNCPYDITNGRVTIPDAHYKATPATKHAQ